MSSLDWMNPMLVKEVRQGLRQKGFWIPFGATLIASLVGATFFFADVRKNPGLDQGRDAFFLFFCAMGLGLFFVAPYSAFRSLSRERDDESYVLLLLTGLPTPKLVRGKLFSHLLQGSLFASATLPFLFFSYYLNGLSLPVLLLCGYATTSWFTFVMCLSVFGATMAERKPLRTASHFVVLAALLAACAIAAGSGAFVLSQQSQLLRERDFLLALFAISTLPFFWAWILFEGAIFRLTPDRIASGTRARLALAATVLGVEAAFVVLFHGVSSDRGVALVIGEVLVCLHLFVFGLFYVTGAERRLREGTTHENHASFWWIVVLASVCTAVNTILLPTSTPPAWAPDQNDRLMYVLFAAPAYLFLYLSLGPALSRLTQALRELAAQRAVPLLSLMLFGVAAPLAATAAEIEFREPWLWIFNPLFGSFGLEATSEYGGPVRGFEVDDKPVALALLWALALIFAGFAVSNLRKNAKEASR